MIDKNRGRSVKENSYWRKNHSLYTIHRSMARAVMGLRRSSLVSGGVEPTSANTVELESTPLDHSGTLTRSDILHCHKIVQKQDHNRYHLTEPKLHQIQRPCLKTASLSLACTYFSTVYVCNNLVLLTGSSHQL